MASCVAILSSAHKQRARRRPFLRATRMFEVVRMTITEAGQRGAGGLEHVNELPKLPHAKINHLLDCEAVREYDRLGRTVAGGRERFERAAAVGLGGATRAAKWGHGVAAAVVDLVGRIPCVRRSFEATRPWPRPPSESSTR